MKPLKDYSFINGVCHNSRANSEQYLKEIGYAKSIGVNSFRTWLSPFSWERDRDAFIDNTKKFISIAPPPPPIRLDTPASSPSCGTTTNGTSRSRRRT